jgi:lipopolysaccharide/colanic/teichoic acid biosynthesis glycosyltransferase
MEAGSVAWDASTQGIRRRVEVAIKRALDIALAAVALVVVSPLLAATALLVKLTSPGPVLFIHKREGRGGREFGCIKFRTMEADAHARQRELYEKNEVDGPQFKLDKDPRVTRIGRWLRRTNIDELPQLFNVLAGQMSLVGPRPSPFRENQICVPWRLARLSVRPGITGMWQICRERRTEGDFHQWIYYDLAYVRHFSLWLDIKILWHTVLSRAGRKRVALSKLIPAYRLVGPYAHESPGAEQETATDPAVEGATHR